MEIVKDIFKDIFPSIVNRNMIEDIENNNDFRNFKLYRIPKYKEQYLFMASLMVINSIIFNVFVLPLRVIYFIFKATVSSIKNEMFYLKYYLIKLLFIISAVFFVDVCESLYIFTVYVYIYL